MPTSLTPPPADDEIECGNCGAYIYVGLSRCPNCGVNLYEPEDIEEERPKFRPKSKFSLAVESVMRKIRGEPHPAECSAADDRDGNATARYHYPG